MLSVTTPVIAPVAVLAVCPEAGEPHRKPQTTATEASLPIRVDRSLSSAEGEGVGEHMTRRVERPDFIRLEGAARRAGRPVATH